MGKGTGVYGAYANVKPITEDFGKIGLEHEQLQFQHRVEQREIQNRKNTKAKDLKNRAIKARKAIRAEHTGIRSEDEKRGQLALKAADTLNEAMKRLEKDSNDVESSLIVSNLEDFAPRFKQMTERYSTWMQDGTKGLEEGIYSPYLNRDHIEKVEQVIKGQVNYGLDDKGNITGDYDQNRDGKADFTWDGMATGIDLPEYKKRFDVDRFKENTKENFGTLHTKNPNGTYNTIEVKELSPESKLGIRKNIETLFGESAKNITDEGLSYIYDELDTEINTPLTDEMLKEAKNRFYIENITMFDRLEFNTKDLVAQDRDQERWRKVNEKKKPVKKQEDADFLRTLVDGTINGDPRSLGIWRDKIIGESKDEKGRKTNIQVKNVEYTKNNIVFDLSNGQTRYFKLNDRERLKGELSSFANYKLPPQESMSIYDSGEVQRELGKTESTKPQSIAEIRNEYKDVVGKGFFTGNGVVKFLKSKGFDASNGWYFSGKNKQITINHKGEQKEFNVSTNKGVKDIINFVSETSGSTKSITPHKKTKENPLGIDFKNGKRKPN
ncbi:hypothetical protein [Aquimarina longa]|uniref:hypothetical protein n=1 Tax=Aquimarina longa TaxID=1080221 RepID=UPI0007858BEF|nr:hypothetical protein [Aquimarina longa]